MSTCYKAAKLLVALVALSLLLIMPVHGQGGVTVQPPDNVYRLMLSHFSDEDFEQVVKLCEQIPDYEDSRHYKQYAQGRLYIEHGAYGDAFLKFRSLVSAEFLDSAAWSAYAEGMSYYRDKDYETAMERLENSQGVADSAAILEEIYKILGHNAPISNLRLLSATHQSLIVAWDAKQTDSQYRVSYAPSYIEENRVECDVSECVLALDGLIPNTVYSIRVQINGQPKPFLELLANTLTVPDNTWSPFSMRDIKLYRYSRNDETKYGLDRLIEFSKTLMTELAGGAFSLDDVPVNISGKGYMLVALLSVNSTDVERILDVEAVLRLNRSGTYRARKQFSIQGKLGKYLSVYVPINELLDEVYVQRDAWPGTAGSIELYVNGAIMGSIEISSLS